MTALAFVDTETTGLDPERHEIWEVGLILRDSEGIDVEHVWELPADIGKADAIALTVGRFYERTNWPPEVDQWGSPGVQVDRVLGDFACEFASLTHGAYLVGAVPSFDDAFLKRLLRANGACPGWSHRLICVETLVAGRIGEVPRGLSKMAAAVGIDPERYETHTALGDARLARDVYDAVMSAPSVVPLNQEALSA